ncbi:hypothetical protein QQ045_008206 [Rhodiola kirilowii]
MQRMLQRVFLYKLPSISTPHFLQNILPTLEHSLSLALKYFFPVAGSLVLQPSSRPHIRYDQGCSVTLTVADESDEDFEYLVINRYGKNMIHDASLSELAPTLSDEDHEVLFGIQVTVFPNSGICIGIAYKHVLSDGRSIMQFLRTWSSIFMNSNDFVPPVLDRSLVPDPGGVLHDTVMKQLASIPPSFIENLKQPKKATGIIKVRATFFFKRSEINKMREWIISQAEEEGEKLHLSLFVLTCSLIWICHVKSQSATGSSNGEDVKDDDLCSTFWFHF